MKTMTMNLIAILLSFAMMLTGVGGEGQPAEASRNLVLHNISVTRNGETVRLGHQARMGMSTDGEKAVFDFGVELGEERMLPVQVGVSEAGVTALLRESDIAVTVTEKALNGVMEQAVQMMDAAMAEAKAESPELIEFLTQEYMPAYAAVLQAATDPEQQKQIKEQCKAAYDAAVDRGEGKPAVAEIYEETYDVTAYSYTLENDGLAAVAEAVYKAVPVVADYYDVMFKLYSMLPEESGLNGIDSFSAMFEKTGVQMRLDIEEQINDEYGIDIMDGALTLDLSGVVSSHAQLVPAEPAAGEGAEAEEAPEAPVENIEIPPLVMNLHSVEIGEYAESSVDWAYEMEGQGIDMTMRASQDGATQDAELDMTVTQDGKKLFGAKMSLFLADDGEGGGSYSVGMKGIVQDAARVDASFYGMCMADGTSENSVSFGLRTPENNYAVSFDLDVTADPIEDAVNGREDAYVIDDLSPEALEALGEDAVFQALMMKGAGSLSLDAAKLIGNEDVHRLTALLSGEALPIDVDDLDEEEYDLGDEGGEDEYTYVIEEGDGLLSLDDDIMDDDGVLAFAEPRFTWLPEGWSVASTDVDTAYDWVEMAIADETGAECAYAIFFLDPEEGTTNYIVEADGTVVDGRAINVSAFDDGGLSVTLREAGLYANMMFTSEAIDVETIGRIVAGMEME